MEDFQTHFVGIRNDKRNSRQTTIPIVNDILYKILFFCVICSGFATTDDELRQHIPVYDKIKVKNIQTRTKGRMFNT